MPYKSENIRIQGTEYDRRVKLDTYQKQCLFGERKHDGTSYNKLAKKYGCSKRLAVYICNPEIYLKAKLQYAERRKDGRYYKKDVHNEQIKDLRHYKQDLKLKGLI